MSLDLGSVSAVNAVWFVPRDRPWREGLATWWRELGAEEAAVGRWLELLQRRVDGQHDWNEALAGQLLHDGRPALPIRVYNDHLRSPSATGPPAVLSMLATSGLVVAFDYWGPGEKGGEPGTVGLEMLVHRTALQPREELWDGTRFDHQNRAHHEKLSYYGDAFGDLMARGCEVLSPVYAISDGMQPLGDFLARAKPGKVRHPAPEGARLADFAWALTYWSPDRVDAELRAGLERLALPDERPTFAFPDGVRKTVRTLSTGGVFLQVRHILGSEGRGGRPAVETPLAKQLGLRSNHLLHKD